MASECQKSDLNFFIPFPRGRWPPEPPKETVFVSALLEPPFSKLRYPADRVQQTIAPCQYWPGSKCNSETSYLTQLPHLTPFLTFPGITLYTCKFFEYSYRWRICFSTIVLTSCPSDGVQVFVVGLVSFVSLLLCIFTDLRWAQGMVLLDS